MRRCAILFLFVLIGFLGSSLFAAQNQQSIALDHYKRGAALASKLAAAQGKAAQQQGDAAIAEFREAIRLDPNFAEAHSLLGWCLFAVKGDMDGGLSECTKGAALNPKDAKLLDAVYTILGFKKDFEAQLGVVRKALILDPNSPHWRLTLAAALQSMGDDEGSLAEYRSLRAQHSEMADVRAGLAQALRDHGDWDGAIAEYREAARLQPNDAVLQRAFRKIQEDKVSLDRMLSEARNRIRAKPKDSSVHTQLGLLLQSAGQWKEAAAEFRTALNLKSEDPVFVHYRLARALLKTQDLDGAVAELHEVIRSGDKNWSADAHLCLASAFDRKGDPKAAQEHRRIAFQIDPYPNHGMLPPAPVLPPPPPPPPKIEKHFVAM